MCVGLALQQYSNSYWRLSSVQDTYEKEAISKQCNFQNMHGLNIIKNHELIPASEDKLNLLDTITVAAGHTFCFTIILLKDVGCTGDCCRLAGLVV